MLFRSNEDMNIHRSLVRPGHFNLMRIPLLEGRAFTKLDEAGAPPVIIVNQTFARRFFAGRSPIGRKVRREAQWMTVVGVAKDSKYHRPTEAPLPYFYMPFRQVFAPGRWRSIRTRSSGRCGFRKPRPPRWGRRGWSPACWQT